MATKAKYKKGDFVTFVAYAEEVPEDQKVLTEGDSYEVKEVDAKESALVIIVPNPDFNKKKKAGAGNEETLEVDVFFDEVEPTVDEADDEAEEEAPAPKTKGKAKAEVAKPAAKGKAKAEAAKPAAKGKAAAKPAAKTAAKGKAKPAAKLKEKAEPEAPADKYGDLDEENENEEILAMVKESDDLTALAVELVEENSAIEYKLGGVLYHLRKDKAYEELDPRYAENKGFDLYVQEQLGLEYRKAMYLVDIYYKFSKFGIDPVKVAELGWTKCAKIAAVMTDENSEELVELAEGSSVSELSEAITSAYKEVGGVAGEKRKKIMFKFRLWEDQAEGVADTIRAVSEQMGFKDESDAFEHIIMEWAAEHPMAPAKKTAVKPAATAKAGKKVTAEA